MRSPYRILLNAITVGCIVSIVVAAYLVIHKPAPPPRWLSISNGQDRSEVLARNLVAPKYYVPIKHLDQNVFSRQSPIYGQITFSLQVHYNEDDQVSDVSIFCETERFRLSRRQIDKG